MYWKNLKHSFFLILFFQIIRFIAIHGRYRHRNNGKRDHRQVWLWSRCIREHIGRCERFYTMSSGQRQRVRIACYFWEILRGTKVTWRTDAKISMSTSSCPSSRSTEVEREHWHVCNINERNWPDNEMQEQCCLWVIYRFAKKIQQTHWAIFILM